MRVGHGLDRPEMTLDVAAQRYWLEVAEGQPSAKNTDYQLRNLLRLLGKDTRLGDLTNNMIAEMISKRRGERIQNARRKRGPNPMARFVSPATVNRDVEMLKRLLRRAYDVWDVDVPRIRWVLHKLPEADPRDRCLSDDEEARLIGAAAPYLRAPIRFAILTGLRLANTVELGWTQSDFQAREIVVKIKSRKPGGKVLVLPITEEILVLLVNQIPRDQGRVFLKDGRPIKSWQTAWRGAKRRAGINDFRWHDLRHTAGTRMVRAGVDISDVQEVLGHASITTTRRYVSRDTGAKRRAMELLSQSRNTPETRVAVSSK